MTLKFGANLGLLIGGAPGEEHYDEIVAQWRGIDALLQGAVASAVITAPPASPSNGDCYIIPSGATGAWAGKTNQIARWTTDTAGANWEYYIPRAGWKIFNQSTAQDFRYTGVAWVAIDSGISYESGDFAPLATIPATATLTAYKCRYSKIGSRVFYDAYLNVSHTALAPGDTYSMALPYPVRTDTGYSVKVNGAGLAPAYDNVLLSGATRINLGTVAIPSGSGFATCVTSGCYETD